MKTDYRDAEHPQTVPFPTVNATQIIRAMSGSSRSVLVEGDDSDFYVVKLAPNAGGPNVLANEVLAERLCRALNLPVTQGAFVYVSPFLLRDPDRIWTVHIPHIPTPRGGIHYGTRLIGGVNGRPQVIDYMPRTCLDRVANRSDFLGMLVFDVWANHQDHRQAVFQMGRESLATFLDHGDMFGGPRNEFDDGRCKAFHLAESIYSGLWDANTIEHWKDKLYEVAPEILRETWDYIPPSWFDDRHRYVRLILASRLSDLDRLFEPYSILLQEEKVRGDALLSLEHQNAV